MRAILADLKASEDATCWCPFESGQSASAVRYAHLLGINVEFCTHLDSMLSEISAPSMVAISASWLSTASGYSKARLAHLVGAGAILYVRGIPQQQHLALSPFSDFRIALAPKFAMVGYRFTNSPLLPKALRGEATTLEPCEVPAAVALPADAIHLMKVERADGEEGTAIFSLRRGKGAVIFDLHRESEDAETPLVERLANPATRFEEVGALSAASLTLRSESERVSSFNLTIDDRPIDFDPINGARVTQLLQHIQEVCPGAHLDFGWTPQYTHPSHAYVEAIKQFPAGFVWHGLKRHVDHQMIENPWSEFVTGRELVKRIEARFGVHLQKIMIFPFERSWPEILPALANMGFLGCVEEPRDRFKIDSDFRPYLRLSTASTQDPSSGLPIFYRYPVGTLTRDRMLAMAAIGLPIIAYGHPDELGLGRFDRLRQRKLNPSHFDPVLRFAASKGLRPCSLEEIAAESEPTTAPVETQASVAGG